MKRYQFNKLIRSKLPARMIREGVTINSKQLCDEDYIVQLKNKIVEEANEVSDAVTKENLTAELADVVEVIHALAKASDVTIEEIEEARLEKRAVNGHFQAVNYVNYIEVAESNHKVIEYLDNKERHYKFDK